jgi:hypothetical protein
MSGDYFAVHHRLLSPKAVPAILESYTAHAYYALKAIMLDVPKRTGRVRLKNLLLPPAYQTAARAFFGSKYNALDAFGAFQEFDKMFPLLVAGAPNFVVGRARQAWEQVLDSVEKYITTPGSLDDASELITTTISDWKSHGFVSFILTSALIFALYLTLGV